MLDAFIIEQIRRREKTADDRPSLELPLPQERDPDEREQGSRPKSEENEGQRGVVIIDFGS